MEIRNTDELTRLIIIWRKHPKIFAKNALGFVPDKWQGEALNDIRDHDQVAIASGQGVGKTSIEAVIILWFLVCFPNSKVVCTAPTKQQLMDVLWAEVAKWLNNSIIQNILKWTKTKVSMVGEEDRWFATARTATKPENMQGFHEDNMLFVVDEASGIADDIMEAILGTISGVNNKIVMMANPTKTSGIFFDAFHKDRQDWVTRKVSSLDSTRTSRQNIDRLIRRYGEESDVVRVRVYGEFPSGEPNAFIKLSEVKQATMREHDFEWHQDGYWLIHDITPIQLGVDVARFGDDETVIATRLGYLIDGLDIMSKQSLTETAGKILIKCRLLTKRYKRPVAVTIDDTGVGGGVTDVLNQEIDRQNLPISLYPVNFASRGNSHYSGVVSLMYGKFKEDNLDKVILPADDELLAQFSVRRYSVESDGKIKIESKKELKKRGYPSPDRAEAVVMAFYKPSVATAEITKGGF